MMKLLHIGTLKRKYDRWEIGCYISGFSCELYNVLIWNSIKSTFLRIFLSASTNEV